MSPSSPRKSESRTGARGIDIADIEFKEAVITEDEAKLIRERRLEKMQEVLEAQGYQVSRPENDESNDATSPSA